ncbi:MAG: N-acetylgalactosamine 6-sulfate sulfatase, partial [Bacteroidota bacterium]
ELYELEKDICEANDISEQRTAKLKAMEDSWTEWDAKNQGPVFLGLLQDSIYNTLHPDRFTRPN